MKPFFRKIGRAVRKRKQLWAFALAYAVVVSAATGLMRFAPAAVALENGLFDKIQRDHAIDSKDGWLYERYRPWLDALCFINLDSAFVDAETDRVRPERLAALLERLAPVAPQAKCIFVDYLFAPSGTVAASDSALFRALSCLGERAVLPVSVEFSRAPTLWGDSSQIFARDLLFHSKPAVPSAHYGYVRPLTDVQDFTCRYFKFRADDGSAFSAPWLINENTDWRAANDAPSSAAVRELHFVLRNHDLSGQDRAVWVASASDIAAGRLPASELAALAQGKIVMLGLFGGYATKYNQQIEAFATPVDGQMPGTLLLANAWLNLAAGAHLHGHSFLLLLLLNFAVGLTANLRVEIPKRKTLSSLANTALKMSVSLALFYYTSLTFLVFWHIKLSLGMSLLIYQQQGLFWTWWQEKTAAQRRRRKPVAANPAPRKTDDGDDPEPTIDHLVED